MKLIAYKVDVNGTPTPVNELGRPWNDDDLIGNLAFQVILDSATVPTDYEDISSIENWASYGPRLVGKFLAFMDWKCLRGEIKTLVLAITGSDIGTNWGLLNSDQQKIACQYITNLVPNNRFTETYTDSNERLSLSLNFDSQSTKAREQRYFILRSILMGKIGALNGILFFEDAVREQRVFAYIGGIESYSEEQVSGLVDFIDGTNKYDDHATYLTNTTYNAGDIAEESGIYYLCLNDNTLGGTPSSNPNKWKLLGLKSDLLGLRHRGYQITDGSGDTLDEVCDTMLGVINGIY